MTGHAASPALPAATLPSYNLEGGATVVVNVAPTPHVRHKRAIAHPVVIKKVLKIQHAPPVFVKKVIQPVQPVVKPVQTLVVEPTPALEPTPVSQTNGSEPLLPKDLIPSLVHGILGPLLPGVIGDDPYRSDFTKNASTSQVRPFCLTNSLMTVGDSPAMSVVGSLFWPTFVLSVLLMLGCLGYARWSRKRMMM